MKTKEDFLLDVRAAIKRNQVVMMMLHNAETGEFAEYINGYGIDFDEILSDFTEMPFNGHIPISKAFEEWQDLLKIQMRPKSMALSWMMVRCRWLFWIVLLCPDNNLLTETKFVVYL